MKFKSQKLKEAACSILFSKEGLRIELHDKRSSTTFAEVFLNPKQVVLGFSRLAYTPCSIEVHDLEHINKKLQVKQWRFTMTGKQYNSSDYKRKARRLALKLCPKGWIPDTSFSSHDSFDVDIDENGKADNAYVTTIIRRWI